MPRPPRVEVPNGLYHVVTRGNRQQTIFHEPEDYLRYLALLREARTRWQLRVIAYALIPNHAHFLVRTGSHPLGYVMQVVQGKFARWYNRKYRLTGHVFQGRYFARLCTDEGYLWALVRYIHDNPVHAALAWSPEAYPWSSARAYAGHPDELVDLEEARALGCAVPGTPCQAPGARASS